MNKKKSDFANSLHDVMQTKAFSKISIADVCKGLNCSRQSFYYYFKSLKECLAYYIRDLAKAKIKEDHMITDTFAFLDSCKDLIEFCETDKRTKNLFWIVLTAYLKKLLDMVLTKKLVDYLSLYSEQKDILLTFYVAGIIQEAKLYYSHNNKSTKEKYIEYTKTLLGSYDDIRERVKRFVCI